MKKSILILTLIILTQFNSIFAQQAAIVTYKPGWHKIAELNVNFRADRDDLVVIGADKFKAIRLKVTDAHVHFDDLDVIYNIPGITEPIKEDVQLRADFKAGSYSRIIYLKYPCLRLEKVVFKYSTVPNWRSEKAHVELWGLK